MLLYHFLSKSNFNFEIDFSTLMTPVNDSPSRDGDTDYETEHDLRRKQLSSLDPVHMLQLKDYFQSQVRFLSYYTYYYLTVKFSK